MVQCLQCREVSHSVSDVCEQCGGTLHPWGMPLPAVPSELLDEQSR